MKKVGLLSLLPILYFAISGGPYGLEELVKSVGPFYSLVLIILVPLFWTLPESMIVGELSSSYPVQGGFYKWVQMGLGKFWGVMEGWWSILYTIVDLSLYPILVVTYLKILFPNLNFLETYLIELLVIWSCAIINIFGIRPVGNVLNCFQYFIFLLFLLFVIFGFQYVKLDFSPIVKNISTYNPHTLLLGVSIAFWNYIGLDNASTVLGEIENPEKNYFKGLFILVPLIIVSYFLPIFIGVCVNQDYSNWQFGEFTFIANNMGYMWLGKLLIFGGMITFLGLFNSMLLTSTRIFAVMSEDKFLPKFFSELHPKYKSPYLCIIFLAILYSVLVLVGFDKLVVYDVFFFLFAMFLEALALISLRRKNLNHRSHFKIPFGNVGLYIVFSMVSLVIIFMTLLNIFQSLESPLGIIITFLLFLSGVPVYYYGKKKCSL